MLILRTLNPETKRCISSFNFMAGEIKTLMVQVVDTDTDKEAQIPASLTVKTLILPSSGSTDISFANTDITQDSTEPSIFSVVVTATHTALMQTGNVRLSWTSGSSPNEKKYQAVGQLRIKKIISVI